MQNRGQEKISFTNPGLVHLECSNLRRAKKADTQKSADCVVTRPEIRLHFLSLWREEIMVLRPSSRAQATVHRTVAFDFSNLQRQKTATPYGVAVFW